jgi:hypothetical protein
MIISFPKLENMSAKNIQGVKEILAWNSACLQEIVQIFLL